QAARAGLIADIDAARESVHILYYIWLNDTTGTNTARALIRAAGRGVKCRVMVDGLGSRAFTRSALWREMAAAGVECAIALPINKPIRTLLTSRIDLRNHRKITVIDGRIGYTGSQNCADPEFRTKPKYAPWVDILLRFEGPVVAQLQLLFASDWLKEVETPLEEFKLESRAQAADVTAAALGDGPTERFGASPQMFCTLIESARRELVVTTPYFVPDQTVIDALCATALRGVKVTLTLPKYNDSWVVAAASRSYYRRFLEAGGEIWEYRPGLLHTKAMSIDGKAVFIGSSNMDMRSFDLNYENDVLIEDAGVTGAVRARQLSYLDDSDRVTLDDLAQWGIAWRMWQNSLATIGPVL
ncbi:MAG TPA: cardiolipin synthase, partial [Aliiroseovarius sp.]|nr:cardiolipin synthase [Aliiroseovarius sp.]